MKVLAEFKDADFGLDFPKPESYRQREAARTVMLNKQGQVALMEVQRYSYHKLPGGGVEAGESYKDAAMREALEETGFPVKITSPELGWVVEERNEQKLLQKSVCFIAEVTGKSQGHSLEQGELEEGLTLKWVSDIDEAISILENDKPTYWEGKFITARDLRFLKVAKQELKEKANG